jgi:hypothetical protein
MSLDVCGRSFATVSNAPATEADQQHQSVPPPHLGGKSDRKRKPPAGEKGVPPGRRGVKT